MIDTPHEQLIKRLAAIDKRFDAIERKLDPIYDIFTSVKGFNGVAVWIIKALIMFGAGIGIIYGFIHWLRK